MPPWCASDLALIPGVVRGVPLPKPSRNLAPMKPPKHPFFSSPFSFFLFELHCHEKKPRATPHGTDVLPPEGRNVLSGHIRARLAPVLYRSSFAVVARQ